MSREKVHGCISEGIGPQESKALSMRLFLIFLVQTNYFYLSSLSILTLLSTNYIILNY